MRQRDIQKIPSGVGRNHDMDYDDTRGDAFVYDPDMPGLESLDFNDIYHRDMFKLPDTQRDEKEEVDWGERRNLQVWMSKRLAFDTDVDVNVGDKVVIRPDGLLYNDLVDAGLDPYFIAKSIGEVVKESPYSRYVEVTFYNPVVHDAALKYDISKRDLVRWDKLSDQDRDIRLYGGLLKLSFKKYPFVYDTDKKEIYTSSGDLGHDGVVDGMAEEFGWDIEGNDDDYHKYSKLKKEVVRREFDTGRYVVGWVDPGESLDVYLPTGVDDVVGNQRVIDFVFDLVRKGDIKRYSEIWFPLENRGIHIDDLFGLDDIDSSLKLGFYVPSIGHKVRVKPGSILWSDLIDVYGLDENDVKSAAGEVVRVYRGGPYIDVVFEVNSWIQAYVQDLHLSSNDFIRISDDEYTRDFEKQMTSSLKFSDPYSYTDVSDIDQTEDQLEEKQQFFRRKHRPFPDRKKDKDIVNFVGDDKLLFEPLDVKREHDPRVDDIVIANRGDVNYVTVEEIVRTHKVITSQRDADFDVDQDVRNKISDIISGTRETVFGIDVFSSIFDKAGALLYGFLVTEPFRNENYGTSLTIVSRFLHHNGFVLRSVDDLGEFLSDVSLDHTEPEMISDWLSRNVSVITTSSYKVPPVGTSVEFKDDAPDIFNLYKGKVGHISDVTFGTHVPDGYRYEQVNVDDPETIKVKFDDDKEFVFTPDGLYKYFDFVEFDSHDRYRFRKSNLHSVVGTGYEPYFDSTPSDELTPEEQHGMPELDDRKLRRETPKRYIRLRDWYHDLNNLGMDSEVSNRSDYVASLRFSSHDLVGYVAPEIMTLYHVSDNEFLDLDSRFIPDHPEEWTEERDVESTRGIYVTNDPDWWARMHVVPRTRWGDVFVYAVAGPADVFEHVDTGEWFVSGKDFDKITIERADDDYGNNDVVSGLRLTHGGDRSSLKLSFNLDDPAWKDEFEEYGGQYSYDGTHLLLYYATTPDRARVIENTGVIAFKSVRRDPKFNDHWFGTRPNFAEPYGYGGAGVVPVMVDRNDVAPHDIIADTFVMSIKDFEPGRRGGNYRVRAAGQDALAMVKHYKQSFDVMRLKAVDRLENIRVDPDDVGSVGDVLNVLSGSTYWNIHEGGVVKATIELNETIEHYLDYVPDDIKHFLPHRTVVDVLKSGVRYALDSIGESMGEYLYLGSDVDVVSDYDVVEKDDALVFALSIEARNSSDWLRWIRLSEQQHDPDVLSKFLAEIASDVDGGPVNVGKFVEHVDSMFSGLLQGDDVSSRVLDDIVHDDEIWSSAVERRIQQVRLVHERLRQRERSKPYPDDKQMSLFDDVVASTKLSFETKLKVGDRVYVAVDEHDLYSQVLDSAIEKVDIPHDFGDDEIAVFIDNWDFHDRDAAKRAIGKLKNMYGVVVGERDVRGSVYDVHFDDPDVQWLISTYIEHFYSGEIVPVDIDLDQKLRSSLALPEGESHQQYDVQPVEHVQHSPSRRKEKQDIVKYRRDRNREEQYFEHGLHEDIDRPETSRPVTPYG